MGLFGGDLGQMKELLEKIMAARGVLPVHELVRRIHEGDASKWHNAVTTAEAIVTAHEEASERSRRMLQALESSWTGEGADAAARKIRIGEKAARKSAEVYAANARVYTDNAYMFDSIKQQLPQIPENPPERDVVDVLTPWDTDTERQINQYKADVERAQQLYQTYEQTMQAAQQSVVKDFGSLEAFDGELGTIERDESGTGKDGSGKDPSTGLLRFDEPSSRSGSPSSGQPMTGGPSSSHGYPTPHPPSTSQYNSGTSTSGYVAPDVSRPAAAAPNYSTPSFNPSAFGPGGSNSSHSTTFGPGGTPVGFGPGAGGPNTTGSTGGGRFSSPGGGAGGGRFSAPGAGGARGMPGGGAAVGGPGALGAGRGVGAMPFGPAGGGGGPAAGVTGGAAGAAGGRGAMPMGAMGGAGGRGGQGGDDSEHQRQYVQSTDEAFALTEKGEVLRDPNTGNIVTPPTIGG